MAERVTAGCAAPQFRFGAGAAFGVCAVGCHLLFSGHPLAQVVESLRVTACHLAIKSCLAFVRQHPGILALIGPFFKSISARKKIGILLRKDWLPVAIGALLSL